MITGELRSKVDKIWETFWTGGLTNPLEVIEQFTYLLFIKGLDEVETNKQKQLFWVFLLKRYLMMNINI